MTTPHTDTLFAKACYMFTDNYSAQCKIKSLQKYRDGYLNRAEAGRQIVADYYAVSPKLIQAIDNGECPEKDYQLVYQLANQCIRFIDAAQLHQAVLLYVKTITTLRRKYGIA